MTTIRLEKSLVLYQRRLSIGINVVFRMQRMSDPRPMMNILCASEFV